MAMKDRMHTGALYLPGDDEIMNRQQLCLDRLYEFNHTRPSETDKRQALMKEMFAELGENCYIEPPFYSNFGGAHVHLGNHVYCNFAVTMVDDTHIYIGDNTMIAPNVTIATAGHPVLPELREYDYQYNMPVHIGRTCWIGAGSVVTKDIPANVVAVGNPCRVLRPISDRDKKYYFRDHPIDHAQIARDLEKIK